MNERDFHDRLYELGHSWQGGLAPEGEAVDTEARGEKQVRAIGDAIVRAAESRRRVRARRRFVGVLAAAAAVCATFFTAKALLAPDPASQMASVPTAAVVRGVRALSGQVTVQHGAGEKIVQQAALSLGDRVSIPPGSKAEVRLGDTVLADALGGSQVSVVADGHAAHRLRVDSGRIEARVDDRPSARPKLIVETPDVEVVVTGTIFDVDVARDPAGATVTRVAVEKGRVVVMRQGVAVALVMSGSTWTSAEAPIAPPAAAPEPAKPRRRAPAGAPSGALPRAPSAANLDDVRVGSLGEENAVFQAAIDARNRGDEATVVDRLGQLLTRYPASPLAGEARVERMRALARLGRVEAAAREARRYLAAFPEGFAREEAKRLVLRSAPAP